MNVWTQVGAPMLAAFLASLVECVEALTVVLAIASLRGWRSSMAGVVAALFGLCGIAVLGRSLTAVPVALAQWVVGGLLLLFGLRWLRKAILRSAGVLALHDESAAYAKAQDGLRGMTTPAKHRLDPIAFWGSCKIVLLEGIEVIFIIVAVATKDGLLWPACLGALAALVLVIGLGALLRRPLARVPENSLKFAAGLLLTAFGSFWLGEGLSFEWPHGDWSVLGLIGFYAVLSLALVRVCRRAAARRRARTPTQARRPIGPVRAAVMEVIGLFIDDRLLAFGAIAWCCLCWLAMRSAAPGIAAGITATTFTAGLGGLLALSCWRGAAID